MRTAYDLQAERSRMHSHATPAELVFRQYYRKRYSRKEFKSQCICGFYILDFVFVHKMLVVEIDGGCHKDRKDYDIRRDELLEKWGFAVFRFSNEEVLNDFEKVAEKVDSAPIIDETEVSFRSALGRGGGARAVAINRMRKQGIEYNGKTHTQKGGSAQ